MSCFIIDSEYVLLSITDFDFLFVEYTFGSNEKVTILRIRAPNNSRSAVDLDTQGARIHEPIQNRKVTRQDGIFGVFEVCVFHTVSMARIQGVWGNRVPVPRVSHLCKHPRFEVFQYKHGLPIHCTHELTIEPIEVLLNYTFTRKSTRGKNSVQAGLGGL